MKRTFLVIILSILMTSCPGNVSVSSKEIKLSGGKIVVVNFEKKETSERQKVFVVEYERNEKILKETTVEKEVLEIWKNLDREIERSEADEGIIRAGYLIGTDEKTGKPEYELFLFNTEKTENGTWQIQKVN